jgi:hypothetical protein
MPAGAPDMAFTPSDSKSGTLPVVSSISDLFAVNQYAFYNLFGPTLGGFMWSIFLIFLIYSLLSLMRTTIRWLFYSVAYPKTKKHHPK